MNAAELIAAVDSACTGAVRTSYVYRQEATLVVEPARLVEVARRLRDEEALAMNLLVDITAVDYSAFGKSPPPAFFASSGVAVGPALRVPDADPWPGPPDEARFAVAYHFYSIRHRHRLRLVVPVGAEGPDARATEVASLTGLWHGADWLEREVWDMFGIPFRGHPDLRRILMYEEFEGHPLRKDYPVNKRQPLIGPLN